MDVLIKIKHCSENRETKILIIGGRIGGLSLCSTNVRGQPGLPGGGACGARSPPL